MCQQRHAKMYELEMFVCWPGCRGCFIYWNLIKIWMARARHATDCCTINHSVYRQSNNDRNDSLAARNLLHKREPVPMRQTDFGQFYCILSVIYWPYITSQPKSPSWLISRGTYGRIGCETKRGKGPRVVPKVCVNGVDGSCGALWLVTNCAHIQANY